MNEEHHFLDEHYASEKSDQPFSSHSEKKKSRFFEVKLKVVTDKLYLPLHKFCSL